MFFGDGEAEFFHDGEHVFPEEAFCVAGGTALKEVAGVVGDADGSAAEVVPFSAHGADGSGEAEKSLGGGATEGDDAFGPDDVDFRADEGHAGGHFLGGGLAVVGRLFRHGGAEFDDVGNVDVLPEDAHGFEDVVELLPGGTDEGFAFFFLVIAGSFADEHEACGGVAGGEDHGVAEGAEGSGGGPG